MIALGCGGDADPYPHGTIELCRRHGRAMADEVKRLLAGPMKPLRAEVSARMATFELAYDPLPPIAKLREAAEHSFCVEALLKRLEQGTKPPPAETYYVAVWAFGEDLAMIFLSDEVVVDYALRLRREFDGRRLWINAYCNDVSFYVASDRLLKEGGYEAEESASTLITYGHPASEAVPGRADRRPRPRVVAGEFPVAGQVEHPFRARLTCPYRSPLPPSPVRRIPRSVLTRSANRSCRPPAGSPRSTCFAG